MDQVSIKVDGITKRYGDKLALDRLSLDIRPGRIHALLGPNGAGKTTTLRVISQLLRSEQGYVQFMKGPETICVNNFSHKIGYLPDNPPLYKSLKVKELLYFAGRVHGVDASKIESLYESIVAELGLDLITESWCGSLSRGFRQRVALAQTLMGEPELLILDEPTLGLDPQSIKMMRNFIELQKQKRTIIISSHLLHEIQLICDDVTIIKDGRNVFSATLTEALHRFSPEYKVQVLLKKWITGLGEALPQGFKVKNKTTKGEFTQLEVIVDNSQEDLSRLSSFLVQNQLGLMEMKSSRGALEDVFFNLTGEQQ